MGGSSSSAVGDDWAEAKPAKTTEPASKIKLETIFIAHSCIEKQRCFRRCNRRAKPASLDCFSANLLRNIKELRHMPAVPASSENGRAPSRRNLAPDVGTNRQIASCERT